MIQKALNYLIDLGKTANPIVEVDDKKYSTVNLQPVKEVGPAALDFNFLDSLVTYIKENIDVYRPAHNLIIEIVSPTDISLHTELIGNFNQRFTPVHCSALISEFPWGKFIDPDNFIIMAQSRFVETIDLASIRAIVGNVKTEEVLQFSDDGISQMVNAKSGVSRVENVVILG